MAVSCADDPATMLAGLAPKVEMAGGGGVAEEATFGA
jgi:hypothetical protein